MVFNVLMMMGIMSRMIPSSALTSAIHDMQDRGAFMSINSSLQHYDTIGYVMVGISLICMILLYRVSVMIKKKEQSPGKNVFQEKPVLAEV